MWHIMMQRCWSTGQQSAGPWPVRRAAHGQDCSSPNNNFERVSKAGRSPTGSPGMGEQNVGSRSRYDLAGGAGEEGGTDVH